MNKFKKSKGITLVALIITVIILLILTVVSIRTVTGDGIIQYAKNAKSEYEIAQANEQALLDTYLEYLNNEIKPGGDSNSGETGNTGSETFALIAATDYGKKIEYNDPAGVSDWKVFYKDANHLYIIASDYLENTKLPTTGLNMSTYSTYGAYWNSTSNFTSTGASDITSAVAEKYGLSWWANNSTSTNNNARATADLLNTTAWTAKFGDSSKGIEAIGSPTLEMWVASWNAKGEKLGRNKYVELKTENNSTGYFVGPTSTSSLSDIANDHGSNGGYYYNIGTSTAGYADKLYFPHTSSYSDCSGYWLASPSVGLAGVMEVNHSGDVSCSLDESAGDAVRPLVSLPSNVITTTADGTLKVAE